MPKKPDWAEDTNYTSEGFSKHPLAGRWRLMMHRCYNPKNVDFPNYRARGITVHPSLQSLDGYIQEIEKLDPPPSPKHNTIDRINNERGYEPGNLRWASKNVQYNNRRGVLVLTMGGKSQTASDWSKEVGIRARTITLRKHNGWTDHEALLVPYGAISDYRCIIETRKRVSRHDNIMFRGEPRFLADVAEELGITFAAASSRNEMGTLDQAT